MKKNITAAIIIATTLAADIATKILIVNNFYIHERLDFLGGLLRITLVYNQGGVFGILQGYKTMFLIVSIIVLILMVGYFFYEKNKSMVFVVSLSLIISGAIGNIIDRLLEGRPGVVDFISVGFGERYRWPTFNVADSVIVIGAFFLVIYMIQEEKRRKGEMAKDE